MSVDDDDDGRWQPVGDPARKVALDVSKRVKTIQGQSAITVVKQKHLRGIIGMRVKMLTNGLQQGWYSGLTIRDALCGDGENTIENEVIDGSPCTIMAALQDVATSMPKFRGVSHLVKLKFSDTRQDAINSIQRIAKDKFGQQVDFFSQNTYESLTDCQAIRATEAIEEDRAWLEADRRRRLIAFVDPNGPKDLPYPNIASLLTSKAGRERADVLVHIAGTAIKRVLGSEVAQRNIGEWIGNFSAIFVEALNADGQAWIRTPIDGDAWDWTMLCYWASPKPMDGWQRAGFVQLNSPEGQRAVDFFTKLRSRRVA